MPNPRTRSGRARRASPDQRTSPGQDRHGGRRRARHVALSARASCGPPGTRKGRTRRLAVLLLFVLALTQLLPEVPALVGDPPPEAPYWKHNAPLAHGNPLRSGYVDLPLMDDPPVLLWQENHSAEPLIAGAVLDENRVFTVDRKGVVVARDLVSGSTEWTHELKEDVVATPALAYGWLYVATLKGNLYALESHTGTVMGNAGLSGEARAATLATEGRVFQGTDKGVLHVLDAESMTEIWQFKTSTVSFHNGTIDEEDKNLLAQIRSAPAVHESRVFFTAWNGRAYGMSIHANEHGNPEGFWSHEVGDAVKAGPAVHHHTDRVLLPTKDGRIVALDPVTGAKKWQSKESASFISGIAVDKELIVARTSDAILFGLNATNGAKKWSYTDPSGHLAAPILTRDAIVQASGNGTFSLLSRTSGKLLSHPETQTGTARWQLQAAVHAPPAVSRNAIAVVDHAGMLSVFGPEIERTADLEALPMSATGVPFENEQEFELSVKNHGPDPVPQILLRIERNGNLHMERTLEGIEAGETRSIDFTFQAANGTHDVKVSFLPQGASDPDPESAMTTRTIVFEEETVDEEPAPAQAPPEGEPASSATFGNGLQSGLLWAAGPGTLGGIGLGVYAARRLRGNRLLEKAVAAFS